MDRHGISTVIVGGKLRGLFPHCRPYHPDGPVCPPGHHRPGQGRGRHDCSPCAASPWRRLAAPCFQRCPKADPELRQGDRVKLKPLGRDGFSINRETVDLRYVEQLTDGEQSAALGLVPALRPSGTCWMESGISAR